MVNVSVEGDRVRFEVEGWDKLWALKSQLEIPLEHIDVGSRRSGAGSWLVARVQDAGTQIPGVLTAGTFYQSDGAVFYDVHDPDRTVVLELDHEHYKRLVIEVEDPTATVGKLRAAIVR